MPRSNQMNPNPKERPTESTEVKWIFLHSGKCEGIILHLYLLKPSLKGQHGRGLERQENSTQWGSQDQTPSRWTGITGCRTTEQGTLPPSAQRPAAVTDYLQNEWQPVTPKTAVWNSSSLHSLTQYFLPSALPFLSSSPYCLSSRVHADISSLFLCRFPHPIWQRTRFLTDWSKRDLFSMIVRALSQIT